MWWGKSQPTPEKPTEAPAAAPDTSAKQQEKAFDPDKLPDRKKLPASLQKIARDQDKDENFFDELVDG